MIGIYYLTIISIISVFNSYDVWIWNSTILWREIIWQFFLYVYFYKGLKSLLKSLDWYKNLD